MGQSTVAELYYDNRMGVIGTERRGTGTVFFDNFTITNFNMSPAPGVDLLKREYGWESEMGLDTVIRLTRGRSYFRIALENGGLFYTKRPFI